jgi:hypothetical protein
MTGGRRSKSHRLEQGARRRGPGRSTERRCGGMRRRRSEWPATWAAVGRPCIGGVHAPAGRRTQSSACSSDELRCSASPPSKSPPKESNTGALNRRQRPRLPSLRPAMPWTIPSTRTLSVVSDHACVIGSRSSRTSCRLPLFLVPSRWPSCSAATGDVIGVAPMIFLAREPPTI